MQFKEPRNNEKYYWTNHVKDKMKYYGISESLIKRIVRFPKRIESGVVEGTNAGMQPTANKKNPQEVWVMWQDATVKKIDPMSISKKKIISAWRYPGISPQRSKVPIPEDILQELNNIL